jgi:hypothetical protein
VKRPRSAWRSAGIFLRNLPSIAGARCGPRAGCCSR